MGLPNIGPLELIIILAIALLIVGPRRLPEMGNAVGRTIREFRKASSDITDATTTSPEDKPAPPETAQVGAPPAAGEQAPGATTSPPEAESQDDAPRPA